jgi:hypothetical protein
MKERKVSVFMLVCRMRKKKVSSIFKAKETKYIVGV